MTLGIVYPLVQDAKLDILITQVPAHFALLE